MHDNWATWDCARWFPDLVPVGVWEVKPRLGKLASVQTKTSHQTGIISEPEWMPEGGGAYKWSVAPLQSQDWTWMADQFLKWCTPPPLIGDVSPRGQ